MKFERESALAEIEKMAKEKYGKFYYVWLWGCAYSLLKDKDLKIILKILGDE